MPVTDFECKMARGQIGRYLGGEPMSPGAMKQLEEHLAECATCKNLVAERRANLLAMLGGEIPTQAVVSVPVPQLPAENPLIAALRAKAEANRPAPAPAPVAVSTPEPEPEPTPARSSRKQGSVASIKSPFGKPVLLAGILGLTLIGMSYIGRAVSGQGLLGSKASSILPEKPAASTESKLTSTPVEPRVQKTEPVKPQVTTPTSTGDDQLPNPDAPVAPKANKVKPEVIKPEPVKPAPSQPKAEAPRRTKRVKTSARKNRTRRPKVRIRRSTSRPASGIRVYAPE